jgi:nicotinate-nucleotide adenylyltransferase
MDIGVFGGSFDPVHNGHMAMAEAAMEAAGLAQVIFMPVCVQPFKIGAGMSGGEHRLAMLELAIKGRDGFSVTDVELARGGVSYTLDSLRAVRDGLPQGTGIFFVLGADMYFMLEKWHMADCLLREFAFVAGARPGSENWRLRLHAERLRRLYGTRTALMENGGLDISSSDIRDRIRRGAPIDGCLPAPVERYIYENGLYAAGPAPQGAWLTEGARAELWRRLSGRLDGKRLRHVRGVAETARALAKAHGADAEKAELAALFHDWFRGADAGETGRLARDWGIDGAVAGNPALLHGRLAAELMAREYGIVDEDVLDAVRYHTTGRAGMSKLEMLLYVADAAEPGRGSPRADSLRELAARDLRKACAEAVEGSIAFVRMKGETLDANSEEALEWLRGAADGTAT